MRNNGVCGVELRGERPLHPQLRNREAGKGERAALWPASPESHLCRLPAQVEGAHIVCAAHSHEVLDVGDGRCALLRCNPVLVAVELEGVVPSGAGRRGGEEGIGVMIPE